MIFQQTSSSNFDLRAILRERNLPGLQSGLTASRSIIRRIITGVNLAFGTGRCKRVTWAAHAGEEKAGVGKIT